MAWSRSFSPQVREDTQVLVLGSMPGQKSLADAEYYAHPRNAFWPIMEALFSIESTADYQHRLELLNEHKVGLWDVYAKCFRPGSLDSSIEKQTADINDFNRLFAQFGHIHTLCFNGKAAEQAFIKHVLPILDKKPRQLIGLPSTSPANAVLAFEAKLEAWRVIKKAIKND